MKDEENDDIVIEDDPDMTSSAGELKKLRERCKQAEEKAKEYLDGWQRAQADFANLRRRDEEAKLEFVKFAKQSLVEELIPVLDSFNIALTHSAESESEQSKGEIVVDTLPIFTQLMKVLQASGLEELNPLKEIFNPHEHEAIATVATGESDEDHKILEVFQKGYKLNGRVVRPAKVKVGEYKGN